MLMPTGFNCPRGGGGGGGYYNTHAEYRYLSDVIAHGHIVVLHTAEYRHLSGSNCPWAYCGTTHC